MSSRCGFEPFKPSPNAETPIDHDPSQRYMIPGFGVIELSSSSESESEYYQSDHPSQLGQSTSLFSDTSPRPHVTPKKDGKQKKSGKTQGTVSNPISCASSPSIETPNSVSSLLHPREKSEGVDFTKTIEQDPSNPFAHLPSRPGKMVVEREAAKASAADHQHTGDKPERRQNHFQAPEFGKPSPLKNPFKPVNVFNQPKSNQPRPEHHRTLHQPTSSLSQAAAAPVPSHPPQYSTHNGNATTLEPSRPIHKPTNPPVYPTYAVPPPMLTARPPNPSHMYGNMYYEPIDLTSSRVTPPVLGGEAFIYTDPSTYLKSDEANKSIKALLEGSVEDEDDKPRTRGRRRKLQTSIEGLSGELDKLAVDKADVAKEQERIAEDQGDEEDEEDDGSVEGLKVKLLPHQIDGLEWLLDREVGKRNKKVKPKGGILADDMGLGKTVQSLALILTHPRPPITAIKDKQSLPSEVGKGTLVVAPLALIKQWEAEIKDKVEDSHALRVCVHHGPGRTKRFEDLKKYDVVITTYQILVSEHSSSAPTLDGPQFGCFGIHWYRVILDEAHSIKNRQAKATKAAYALRSEYRWCLTGTPMQNNLDELQSLIQFLRIKPYNDISTWKSQITGPMNRGLGGLAVKRLNVVLKQFMKRRTKDILKKEGALNPGGKVDEKSSIAKGFQIMERNVRTIEVEFGSGERAFYNRLEQRTDKSLDHLMNQAKLNYASALVLLLRLRQACNHPDLIKGDLADEKEALTTGLGPGSQSPRKGQGSGGLDDLAGLLGGLSVETEQCKQCLRDLLPEEASSGMRRCAQCEELNSQGASKGDKESLKDRSDSDLGVAGSSGDEDAEGSGDTLGSNNTDSSSDADSDSGSDDDSAIRLPGSRRRKAVTIPDSNEQSLSSIKQEPQSKQPKHNTNRQDPMVSAKIRHLIEILEREAPKQKIIVFSVFTSMLDLIEPHLRGVGHTYTRYDGSMRNDAREASLDRLRKDKKCRILLCSLKCGSLGLNLTAASCVIIMEPFWNPFVEEQAIDRVHRINQTRDVMVYKMTVRDTVEARIIALQERKRALAEATIEGKSEAGKLSMKELIGLFDHKAESDASHRDEELDKKLGLLGGEDEEWRGTQPVRHAPVPKQVVGRGKEHEVYGRRW